MARKHTCETCHFWASLAWDQGECTALDHGQESVVRIVILERTIPGKIGYFTNVSPADYRASLLTPPDHYCASWQRRRI